MEVSSGIVWADVDAAGRGTGLSATVAGDVLASSVLTTNIREAITRVEDSSSTWDSGGDASIPSDVSGKWENTFDNVNDVSSLRDRVIYYIRDGSGNIGNTSSFVLAGSGDIANVSSYLNASGNLSEVSSYVTEASGNLSEVSSYVTEASGNISEVSGYVTEASGNISQTSSYINDASGNITNVSSFITDGSGDITNTSSFVNDGSGDITNTSSFVNDGSGDITNVSSFVNDGSGNIISVSANFYSFSANIQTSTVGLSSLVDALAVSSTGISSIVDALELSTLNMSSMVDASTAGIAGISGTAWLNGATPTLTNPLRGDDLTLCSTANDLTLSTYQGGRINLHGTDIRVGNPLISLGETQVSARTSISLRSEEGDIILSAGRYATLSSFSITHLVGGNVTFNKTGESPSSLLDITSWLAGVSGLASAVFVGNTAAPTSSISVSGAGAGDDLPPVQTNGMILAIDEESERAKWVKQAFQYDPINDLITFGDGVGGGTTVSMAGGDIAARNLDAGTTLSAADTCLTQLDGPVILTSSMDMSGDLVVSGHGTGLPYPPPYCHIRSTTNGVTSDALYVAFSGAAETTVSSNATHFEWDDTNKRVYVSSTGVYEVTFIGNAFTDTTNDEVYTRVNIDGTQKTYTRQRINTNTDPHILTIAWVGSVTAGEYITITIDGTQNTTLYPGTTLTIKRLS